MADNEQKALQLVEEAEKKLGAKSGFLSSLFGGSSKTDEALEMLARAANMFKMAKKWSQAGNTFSKIGNHHVKEGAKHDAATNYVDAANCFKKTDPKEAAASLQKAIDIYTDMGRFTIAAKHHQTVAELFESEAADLDCAIQHYETAADYFKGEESTSSATKCLVKVAQYSAQLEKYDKAIQIYEQIAATALQSSLLKYSAKDHFFRASLCHLCVDSINAQHAVSKYEEQHPAFGDSREAKLVKTLISEIENQDIEAFTVAVKQYDSISRLDAWYTTLLLRVKKGLSDGDDLR
eukprot:GFUD01129591.1.p1 GENE.GFUD01129591.1~~GFUD01129591.1.p1  ORF type:complete len:293 (-),score=128.24 GFUD01129591.1:136-1014(-)